MILFTSVHLFFIYDLVSTQYFDYGTELTAAQHGSPWNTRDNDYYYDPLHPDGSLPTIISDYSNNTLKENESVILPCVVERLGSFTLSWQHEDQTLWVLQERQDGPIVTDVIKDRRITRAGTSLHINNITANDAGNYTCLIDTQPVKSITHYLQVIVPPSVYPLNNRTVVTVKEGSVISLVCVSSGYPKPTVTWYKHKGEVIRGHGSNLTLHQVKPSDQGVYVCVAENDVHTAVNTTIVLQVMYAPRVRAVSERVYSGPGHDTSISCIVLGEPQPQVKWFRQGVEPVNILRLSKTVDTNNRFSLQFSSVQNNDFGNYTCNATNFMGNDSAVIGLLGRPMPVRYYSASEGENETTYTLLWQVESYSPILTYTIHYKNESDLDWVTLTVPGTTSHHSHFHSGTHTLTHLQPGAAYVVKVTATNEFGDSDNNDTFTFTTYNSEDEKESEDESLMSEEINLQETQRLEESDNETMEDGGLPSRSQDQGISVANSAKEKHRNSFIAYSTAIALSFFFY